MDFNTLLNPWLQTSKEYSAGKTFEYVMQKYGFAREEILRLAGNESTIGLSPLAIEAATKAITGSNYYDEARSESLVAAIEKSLASQGHDLTNTGVVVGNGMDSIIDHLLMLFTDANCSIVDCPPTFTYYDFAAKRLGVEVIDVTRLLVDGSKFFSYKIDIERIKISVKANTKIVFVCSPNNPDGSVLEFALIEDLAKFLLEKNILLFVDHAYIDFCDRTQYDATKLINQYPNLIVGFTFSKAYALAGFRVGYALLTKELQTKYFNQITPFLCSRPSIAAAKAALADQAHLLKIIDSNTIQRAQLGDRFRQLGLKVFETHANFYLLESTTENLLEKLLAKGIIIRAMPSVSDSAYRITIGTEAENSRLITALENII